MRHDVAMTGEVTLSGKVLEIGGVKEKSLAAQRAGIKLVIVPDRNKGDVEEISVQEREGLDFVYADDIGDVLGAALETDRERGAGSLPLHPGKRSEETHGGTKQKRESRRCCPVGRVQSICATAHRG